MSKAAKTTSTTEEAMSGVQEDVISKRIEEQRAKRKDRGVVNDTGFHQKLSVPKSMLDPRLEYRWGNDVGTRIMDLKEKGYIPVSDLTIASDDRNSGLGSVAERVVNSRTTEGGRIEKAVLMAKPKEFYAEDKSRELAKVKADEGAITRGEAREADGTPASGMYVPSGGMRIKQGN